MPCGEQIERVVQDHAAREGDVDGRGVNVWREQLHAGAEIVAAVRDSGSDALPAAMVGDSPLIFRC